MRLVRGVTIAALSSLLLPSALLAHHDRAGRAADVTRTVYFSAVDAKGAAVTDLTATDLVVKEGGKELTISGLSAATEPIQISILVDDAGTGGFQGPVAQFLESMLGHGQFAIRAFNPQPSKVADFTEDVAALKTAIGAIGPRGKVPTSGDQMIGAVSDAANELQRRKAARSAIVVLTVGGEKAGSNEADSALNAVKNSGASLNVICLAGIELGQVLGDGPKRSGGVIQQIAAGVVLGPVLAKVADNLLKQYALTYTLPDGVKPNEQLSLTTTRKDVKLIAPTRVRDK